MDINKWLAETAVPEEQDLAEQLGLPSFLRSKKNPEVSPDRERRKRKRALPSSNSSYLEAEKKTKSANLPSHTLHKDQSSESDASHVSSSDFHASNSEPENAEDKYKRKARHKTKPDRYDPKDGRKKRESKKRTDKRKESKETRKSKRRKKEKPGTGLIQSFHANNVPKDRLTLKPTQNIGLFKKGRASSPRRGKGLPDLTFSEMRFLQKGTHDDQENMRQSAKDARRKERARGKDIEISEYFNAKRPPLKEKDPNIESKPYAALRQDIPSVDRRRHTSVGTGSIMPTVELLEKPFLGFGGRGANHTETSYFSWSESPRQPSCPQSGARQSVSDNVRGGGIGIGTHSDAAKPVRYPSQPPIMPARISDRTREEHTERNPMGDHSYAKHPVEQHESRSTSYRPPTRGQPFRRVTYAEDADTIRITSDNAAINERAPKQSAPSDAIRHNLSSGGRPPSSVYSFHYDQGLIASKKLPGPDGRLPPAGQPARRSSEQPQRFDREQANDKRKQEAIPEQRAVGQHEAGVEASKSSSSFERLIRDCGSVLERPSTIRIPARVRLNPEVESISVQARRPSQIQRFEPPPLQMHQSQLQPLRAPVEQYRPPSRPGFIRRPELYFGEEFPVNQVQPVIEYPWNRAEGGVAADPHSGLLAQESEDFAEEKGHFEPGEVEEGFEDGGGEEYSHGYRSRDEFEQQQPLQLQYSTLEQNDEDIFAGFWRPNRLY